uniref:Uncharacterized protein n=1 Tax=viral metagenome TaxID=1070528 RepID=A0A6C0LSJ5_9ZZZZ
MSKRPQKLGLDKSYKRPVVTKQEQFTVEEISKRCQGYIEVDDIAEVPLNTHIRYFIKQSDGTEVYRNGGFLYNKSDPEKYIMLTNGKQTWSVQVKNSKFYKKMSQTEQIESLTKIYQKKIDSLREMNEKKNKYISELYKYIYQLTGQKYRTIPEVESFLIIDKNKSNNGVKTNKSNDGVKTNNKNKTVEKIREMSSKQKIVKKTVSGSKTSKK